ncbi:hypothetical protein PQQ68_29560, partial [Paraburkholderia dilworthii]
MRFEVEGKATVDAPRESAIRRGIKSFRSYGPSSFASLRDVEGNYVQVGGGGACLVERYFAASNQRLQSYRCRHAFANANASACIARRVRNGRKSRATPLRQSTAVPNTSTRRVFISDLLVTLRTSSQVELRLVYFEAGRLRM